VAAHAVSPEEPTALIADHLEVKTMIESALPHARQNQRETVLDNLV
jgi:hypothetical protein